MFFDPNGADPLTSAFTAVRQLAPMAPTDQQMPALPAGGMMTPPQGGGLTEGVGNARPVLQLPDLAGFLSPATNPAIQLSAAPVPTVVTPATTLTALANSTDDGTRQAFTFKGNTTKPSITPDAPKPAATQKDTRPEMDISGLPKLTIAHLKALAPFLTANPKPVDPLKSLSLDIINKQHEEALRAAGGDAKMMRDAEEKKRSNILALIQASAAPYSAVAGGPSE